MMRRLTRIWIFFCLCLIASISSAQSDSTPAYFPTNEFGQTIQIQTRLHSFLGKPTWLLVIRDLDHNQNIPYVYDFHRAENFWLAFTYGRNYLILASTLQIETYKPRENRYKKFKINNFCHLESNGRINRGTSMYLTISGHLSANTNTFSCHLLKYQDADFSVAPQSD